jgi:hypothetical protein
MHTAGVDEQVDDTGVSRWFVQSECLGCGLRVGADAPPPEALALVDRLIWTDDAGHVLERMPPYLQQFVRREVEDYARARGEQVITFDLQLQARRGEHVIWDPDAERRLANVPAPVRAMARMELERTAVEAGQGRVTVGLMEQVKARYFGMGGRRDGP